MISEKSINLLPNDLRDCVVEVKKLAQNLRAKIRMALATASDQVESGEITDDQWDVLADLLYCWNSRGGPRRVAEK